MNRKQQRLIAKAVKRTRQGKLSNRFLWKLSKTGLTLQEIANAHTNALLGKGN